MACLVVGTATIACWPWLSEWLELPADRTLACVVAASLVGLALLQVTSESLRGFHDLRWASLLSGGQTGGLSSNLLFLVFLGGLWSLAPARFSLSAALLLNLASMVLVLPWGLIALSAVSRRRLQEFAAEPRGPGLALPVLLGTCLPLMLIQAGMFASTQADLWIAGAYCPHDQLALYGAARRLMLLIVIPMQMANFLVIGSISELYAQGRLAALARLVRRTAGLAAIPSAVALVCLMVLGGPILTTLFGSFYRNATWPLVVLSIGQLALSWSGSSHCTLLMTGHQNEALAVNTFFALALIVAGRFAAQHFGILGLATTASAIMALEQLTLVLLVRLVGIWTHIELPIRPQDIRSLVGFWRKARSAGQPLATAEGEFAAEGAFDVD